MIAKKWQQLIEKLEITTDESGSEVFDAEELESVEGWNKIKLPTDYKEFCQTLGTGLLADRVRIFCLTEEYIANERSSLNRAMLKIQEHLQNHPLGNLSRDRTFIDLLKLALPFGDLYDSDLLLVWDLRTYSASDDSYDIYLINCGTPECDDPILLDRVFFDFVQNFCYGSRLSELLPDIFDLPFTEKDYTFFQFKPQWS